MHAYFTLWGYAQPLTRKTTSYRLSETAYLLYSYLLSKPEGRFLHLQLRTRQDVLKWGGKGVSNDYVEQWSCIIDISKAKMRSCSVLNYEPRHEDVGGMEV